MKWYQRLLDKIAQYVRPHQRGPVRRFFSTGLLALTVAGLLTAANLSSPSSTVFLTSPNSIAVVGEQFYLDVRVGTNREVNTVAMDIMYPDDRLTINQLRDGESVLSIWTETPRANDGVITLSGGTFRRGFTGEHRIIRIAATPIKAGEVTLQPGNVQLLVGDGTGDQLTLDAEQIKPFTIRVVDRDALSSELSGVLTDGGIRGDLTGDGRVTMQDISIFMSAWTAGSPVYDFTGDGRMTFRDFSVLLANFFRLR